MPGTGPRDTWDNRRFWNTRYEQDPWIGSGPGSRGYAQVFKQQLLADVVACNPVRSIADVGCGDLCWLPSTGGDAFEAVTYVGFDVSDVILDRNRRAQPKHRFEACDIVERAPPGDYDLLVCFDVLIHQLRRENFERALSHLLATKWQHAMISYKSQDSEDEDLSLLECQPFQRAEHEFKKELWARAVRKDHKTGFGRTANHGELLDWIGRLRPDLRARPIGTYRYQTVYEVTPDAWLRRAEP